MTIPATLDYRNRNQRLHDMATIATTPTKGKNRRTRASLHMDMTPMVDLAFLLLTFFIMTTRLLNPVTMQITMPDKVDEGKYSPLLPDQVLNLVLEKDNRIYWYVGLPGAVPSSTDYSSSGVRKVLLDKKREISKLHVLVKPADGSRYQNVVDVLDELSISGIERYTIVDTEAQDRELAL